MPRRVGEHYFRDEGAFERALDTLNALTSLYNWRVTTARREHTDVFGEPIAVGEDYYSREIGLGWSDVIKVSRLSMERLLYVVVGNNPRMAKLVEALRTSSPKEVAAAIYAPLGEEPTEAEG